MSNQQNQYSPDLLCHENHLSTHSRPFLRGTVFKLSDQILIQDLLHVLRSLQVDPLPTTESLRDLIKVQLEFIANEWKKRAANSEIALKGMLLILECCMWNPGANEDLFEQLIRSLGFQSVQFWKMAVPFVFESDFSSATKYRDSLLFALTLYDVNTGKNKLRELYAAVPGIRESLLGQHAKQFGERFHHLQKRISRHASLSSLHSEPDSALLPQEDSSESEGEQTNSLPAALASSHFHGRVINVSNAPPVTLKRQKSGEWEMKQGSGGLVACVDPIMTKREDNLWLANFGLNMGEGRRSEHALAPATNTLGLPLIKQHNAQVLFHVLAEDDEAEAPSASQKKAREELSLLGVLNNYNRGRYKLNPVVVQADDYAVYYGGISNGLLWPALHNLPEYIAGEYNHEPLLRQHWCSYVRVNYQFAIDAVRNSRPQDFIWIHDYHLVLVGLVMQSLDPNIEVGFFLHIPFQPPTNFFDTFKLCAIPLLRGLLRFTKVGFQTHRDRQRFVEEVERHVKGAKITFDQQQDIFTVAAEGSTSSLGVFPVSIRNDDFLKFVDLPETSALSSNIRKKVLGKDAVEDSRLFFSVERFDYTKGIREKLLAFRRYLEKYPERQKKDVLYQVAVTNRRSVDTYRAYQDECIAIADSINSQFACGEWKPVVLETDGLPRPQLVACYCAMDIGVVKPRKDGMNLVAKEMIVVNPRAGLLLSTGAGTEIQLYRAGLYEDKESGRFNYTRVDLLADVEVFADAFHTAMRASEKERAASGAVLHSFILHHDIERWSEAFLDPGWTHHVIRRTAVLTLDDFFSLIMRTRHIRRQIVERVLEGIPIRHHFIISLTNAKESLESGCEEGCQLKVRTSPDSDNFALFDIREELVELERDLSFLKYVQSDNPDNIEQFVQSLLESRSEDERDLRSQVEAATSLMNRAGHFDFFFTDRDGTLKSYSCSYAASIQPAYSGVIQAQFARRCAQRCAILTTAPMLHVGILDVSTIPEGYYYYGASGGREWYISPQLKFKDTLADRQVHLLDQVFARLSSLLEETDFHPFTWIGSGLQKHYGHVTIAFQDVHGSVPSELAMRLKKRVEVIVDEIDPAREAVTIIYSARDIKCLLKGVEDGDIFNKGNGIRLLCQNTNSTLENSTILVCGDSETDVPMLKECLMSPSARVYTIWVTRDEELQRKVRLMCEEFANENVVFVDRPEILLGAMAQATVRETCRPRQYT